MNTFQRFYTSDCTHIHKQFKISAKMPTEARNAEQEMMGVEGATNGFHDHQLPDSPLSHDDGYFTSAVSVQHKVSKKD